MSITNFVLILSNATTQATGYTFSGSILSFWTASTEETEEEEEEDDNDDNDEEEEKEKERREKDRITKTNNTNTQGSGNVSTTSLEIIFNIDLLQPLAMAITHPLDDHSHYPAVVTEVHPNGQAHNAGITTGMHIIQINGVDCKNKEHKWVTDQMKDAKKNANLNNGITKMVMVCAVTTIDTTAGATNEATTKATISTNEATTDSTTIVKRILPSPMSKHSIFKQLRTGLSTYDSEQKIEEEDTGDEEETGDEDEDTDEEEDTEDEEKQQPVEMDDLVDAFSNFDRDDDGRLSLAEIEFSFNGINAIYLQLHQHDGDNHSFSFQTLDAMLLHFFGEEQATSNNELTLIKFLSKMTQEKDDTVDDNKTTKDMTTKGYLNVPSPVIQPPSPASRLKKKLSINVNALPMHSLETSDSFQDNFLDPRSPAARATAASQARATAARTKARVTDATNTRAKTPPSVQFDVKYFESGDSVYDYT